MGGFFQKYRDYFLILLFVLCSSSLVWLPFVQQLSFLGIHIPNTDTGVIYRNFDGLLYVIAAKSWYVPAVIDGLKIEANLASNYYAAHLPLYPAAIALLGLIMNHVKAMMVVTVGSTVVLGWFFYYFVRKLNLTAKPLLLTFIFLMLPRFLVVRSVGSPESLFILFILASLFFFEKKNYLLAGVAGGLATMTKLPGILLFPAFVIYTIIRMMVQKKFEWRSFWLLLIPAGLLVVCLIYQQQYGDFFAYWHTGYVVPMPYPFSAFNASAKWVGTHWLEELVLYFGLYSLTLVYAFRHKVKVLFPFVLCFFGGLLLVQHRDISRYALPLWPIACIVFERFLTSKKTLIGLAIILPAIYLYAWTFLQGNAMPVGNWSPFL